MKLNKKVSRLAGDFFVLWATAYLAGQMVFSSGVRYMLLATVYYAGMNLCIKLLPNIPAHQVVFIRSIITFFITLSLIKKAGISPWGNHKGWLVLRGLAGFSGLLCYIITVQKIPLASAVTIQYLSPIFTLIFAYFMLNNELSVRNWIFTFIAFAGVLLVKGFDHRISNTMFLLGMFSALMSGLAYTSIRKLSISDHALVIVFYFPLVTIPLIGPYTLSHWTAPTIAEWGLLIGTGIFTQFGQYYMTRAYQLENISTVSILTYVGTLYALITGYFFFDEAFKFESLLGMGLIIAGVALNLVMKTKTSIKPAETEK